MVRFQYLKNVTTLQLDTEKCIGCGRCAEVCPHDVFTIVEGKAIIGERDDCMECGACAMNCKPKAISVKTGVGCASGVIMGAIRGTEPTCDCSSGSCC